MTHRDEGGDRAVRHGTVEPILPGQRANPLGGLPRLRPGLQGIGIPLLTPGRQGLAEGGGPVLCDEAVLFLLELLCWGRKGYILMPIASLLRG
jgi:hypothetical protein